MGKPRAVRKQPIVLSSDDEGDAPDSPPPPKRPKRGTLIGVSQTGAHGESRALRSSTRRVSSPKPQSSRATTKSPAKLPAKPKAVHKPITSFFSNIPQSQLIQSALSSQPPAQSTPAEELDDILDSSGDEHQIKRPTALPVRKRINDVPSSSSDAFPKASQKFLTATNGARETAGARSTPLLSHSISLDSTDTRPWNEKYGPVSVEELAVHKRKVADVRIWLSDVFNGTQRKRLLLLKGPAGSGKTATLSLLSKELGFDIHEWRNPAGASYSSEGFVSVTAQFEDFVGRTGAFGSLVFDESARARPTRPTPATSSRQKQLILVEEFPNTFARASSAVQSFRASVLNFLAATTPSAAAFFAGKPDPDHMVTPIVMIISETLLSTNTAAADSFTAHRLLGPEILSHPGVSVIEFNPIAPTFMTKALELIVLKEARQSGRRRSAGPQVIQRLAELGDIRSAVSSLEFLCVRGDGDGDWGGKITFAKKKASKDIPMTKMEQESLEMVTQRESTLGIFHAVGRVVYNKRLPEDPTGRLIPQPPNWFPERRRPKVSEVQVDSLIDELGTDTQTFIAALHENYILSCGAADSEETMDAIEGCIDALSDADLLSPDRFGNTGFDMRNFQGTSADTLRQDEMSFQTSVRGLLYHLPTPVKRAAPPPGIIGTKGKASKGNPYVMYYPSSLRLWRQQEELGGLLDIWVSRVQRGELFGPISLPRKPLESKTGGVDTWRRTAAFVTETTSSSTGHTKEISDEPPQVLLGGGGSARYEMLLERLPYLQRILHKTPVPFGGSAATIRDIQKLTTFTGTGMIVATDSLDDDADEELPVENEQWTTDRPGSNTPKKQRSIKFEKKKRIAKDVLETIAERDVRSLVLSDDDIED